MECKYKEKLSDSFSKQPEWAFTKVNIDFSHAVSIINSHIFYEIFISVYANVIIL